MRAPRFWYAGGPLSVALAPLGALWALGAAARARGRSVRAPVPVICVGNIVVGGAGKTPVAISLASHLPGAHFLSRGYGGSERGPLRVDLARHDHRLVGDEALLLARVAPAWVARDRVAGARAAAADGAACVIMDDGYQDPSIAKDISLLVIDGQVGFGAARCLPAGPLREPVAAGLARAQAVVLVGEDKAGVTPLLGGVPILRARIEPEADAAALAGHRILAFAGIGRPAKFFHTLQALGAELVETHSFADHHPYAPSEVDALIAAARARNATPMTTAKDFLRLPPDRRGGVEVLRIAVHWDDEVALARILAPIGGVPP